MRYFTNEVPKVVGANLSDKSASIVNLKYKKFNGIIETGFFTKEGWDETLEIYFEYGSLKINLPPQHYKNLTANFVVYNSKSNNKQNFKFVKGWSFKNQCDAFINDIKRKKINVNKASEAVKDIKVIENIWKIYLKNDTKNNK